MTRSASPLPAPSGVLIIKPSSLGDVVTALPVLRGLRRTFPQARTAWLLSSACAPLLADDEDLDEIILFDRHRLGRAWRSPSAAGALIRLLRRLRAGRFDWVLDLQGLFRSAFFAMASGAELRAGFADAREGASVFYTHSIRMDEPHTVDRNIALARRLGVDARLEDLRLSVPPAARGFAEEFRRRYKLTCEDFIACVPPTRWANKQYPLRHWRSVVAALSVQRLVALLGAPAEVPFCRTVAEGLGPAVVNLAGQTSVAEMAGLIAASGGVVCSDSAAQFIACAVGVDVVTLAGPTRPERTGPYRRGRVIRAEVPCRGCLKRRCRHVTCMETISPAEVVSAAAEMFDDRGDRCRLATY